MAWQVFKLNLYTTVDEVKARQGITGTGDDAILLGLIEGSSREIDRYCKRHFYVHTDTRIQSPEKFNELRFDDDLLVVSTFKADTDNDGLFDDETWAEGTDFHLEPTNSFPKNRAILTGFGDFSFTTGSRTTEIVGEWGYGDGESATPYEDSGFTGTLDSASDTSLSANSDPVAKIGVGNTLLIESEQVFVSAASGTALTVEREVNGTTAVAHTAKALNVYQYPANLSQICAWLAGYYHKHLKTTGMAQERLPDYFYTKGLQEIDDGLLRILGPYRRGVV